MFGFGWVDRYVAVDNAVAAAAAVVVVNAADQDDDNDDNCIFTINREIIKPIIFRRTKFSGWLWIE